MADIRLFGLTLDASNVLKVMRDVKDASVSMAREGAKNAQSWAAGVGDATSKVARTYIPETIRAIEKLKTSEQQRQATFAAVAGRDQTVPYMRGLAQASTEAGRAMAKLELQAREMDAALNRTGGGLATLTNAGGRAGTGLNSLRSSMTSFTASLLQTAPGVAQFSGMLGSMALGSGVMIGAMAGMAAITLAYKHFTEQAKEAQKQAEETRKEFEKIAHMSVAGQGAEASRLYSGDPFSTKPIETFSIKQLEHERDIALARTKSFTADLGDGMHLLSQDAKAAADNLKAYNTELTRRRDLLASITGPGGTLTRAGTAQAAQDLPGFTTDKLNAEKKFGVEMEHEGDRQTAIKIAQYNEQTKEFARNYQEQTDIAVREFNAQEQAFKELQDNEAQIAVAQFNEQTREAKRAYQEETDAAIRAFNEQEKYRDEIRKDWRRGIDDIIAHGLDSFSGFFQSVLQMFSRLLADMEKAGKGSSMGAKLLGLGSAAIGGGLAGYSIGQRTGGALSGALGGAGAGALAGSAYGPWGAAIGGLAGAAGGLLGASDAQRAAAEQLSKAAYAFNNTLDSYVTASYGDDAASQALAEEQRYVALFNDARKLWEEGALTQAEWIARMTAIQGAYERNLARLANAEALAKKQAYEDVQVQILRNNGDAVAANALAKRYDQERRFAELRKQGIDEATLAVLKQSEATRDMREAVNQATSAMLNVPTGYKIALSRFNAETAVHSFARPTAAVFNRTPSRTTPQSDGDLTVNLTLDGKVASTVVLKDFKRRSQAQFGTSTRWSEVQ